MNMAIGSSKFVGSKNGSGVWQRIISEMPPHRVYVEPFAGTGVIGQKKKPAACSIFIDDDPRCPLFSAVRSTDDIITPSLAVSPDISLLQPVRSCNYIIGDAVQWILTLKPKMSAEWLLYIDPPYLMSVRRSKREYYAKEFHTEDQHRSLLSLILTIKARVMISGYDSDLYNTMLKGWRKIYIPTVTRGGKRSLEVVWMNFPENIAFHDVRYLGKNYRERERLKRKKNRWLSRLQTMPRYDRAVLIDAIGDMINKKPD